MKDLKLTEEQLQYVEHCINDEIESAKAVLAIADRKADKLKAERDLLFFEEFKKALM